MPRVVCALARERLFHGSDIGRLVSELSGEHADWDMSELGDGAWWYAPEGRDPFTTAELEPAETFEARMEEFVAWLEDRPEKSIAVVSHWGVCYSLTGDESFKTASCVRSISPPTSSRGTVLSGNSTSSWRRAS